MSVLSALDKIYLIAMENTLDEKKRTQIVMSYDVLREFIDYKKEKERIAKAKRYRK